ncbi:hypothetical protein HYH03_005093 [Edaphochlamys debaryana]|uniref:Apple domain-containing protein n=1 Tax=Edaphochlamys debaryana TaxID=47281 RepID=A0A836C1E8_9CHLO|nr:hypothetical protein HYH03_005093 [Edaphochlamys debaryana]|eukprot:KAG2496675.1 hypothetical protein HYH03_005093 [Edaphochlamys debaryana]
MRQWLSQWQQAIMGPVRRPGGIVRQGRPGGAAGQCGGRGGFCGIGGVGPCEDAAWKPPYYPCRAGQLCLRANEQWWQCAEPGTADQWEQCGGVGGKCGYCQPPMGDGGDPSPCLDAPWPSRPCKRGLTCVRDTPYWWHCAPVAIIPSSTAGGPISEFQQCGGTGSRCNTTGYGPCVDASWAAPLTCRAGLACKRAERWWWQCEPAPPPGGACTLDAEQRYWGGGFRSGTVNDAVPPSPISAPNAAFCARACETTPACITWVWDKVQLRCQLLAALYSGSTPHKNFTSGSCSFKLSGSTGCTAEPGQRFLTGDDDDDDDDDDDVEATATAADCAAACSRLATCITYTWEKATGDCHLQANAFGSSVNDTRFVSGVCPRKTLPDRDRLRQGQCLVSGGPCRFSTSGRFSVCVRANGDIELLDGTVPYWRRSVNPVSNRVPPYRLCVLPNGDLAGRNANNQTYFTSGTGFLSGEGTSGPYEVHILDDGNLNLTAGGSDFAWWSSLTEGVQLNLTGYTFFPKQDFEMDPGTQTLDRWIAGNSSFADYLRESHPFPSVMKDLCDADPLCTAFNTDGVFKRGPIWSENVQLRSDFTSLKQGIYAKPLPAIVPSARPRAPASAAACGPGCVLDTGRSDDVSKQYLLKRTGASNILSVISANPHINWWLGTDRVIPNLQGKPVCVCPGPGAEAARWNKTRAVDFSCLADTSGAGPVRPCSGLSTDYARAVCFCMQQLTDNAKYVWPFRTPGAAYDCSSFIECRGNRPVVVNGKVRRSCDSRTDPNEPEACPGCTAFDTVTGQEGFPGRICRRASLLPGVKDTVQCTEREPGSLCHWWLLPPGVYQDPYDESGMLVMRCPVDTYDAMWSPAPPGLEYCAAPDEGDNGYVFSTAMQTCIPRPPGWDAWRDACPTRKVTIVSEDSLSVLSACESAFMGAPEKWTNASRGSVVGHRHRSRELLQVVSTDASLWRNPQTTNCPDPESCCPKLLNQAARNYCLTVPRTVGGIGYAAAETCVLNKECGSADFRKGTSAFCRCLYAGFVSRGLRPGNCPRARHFNCRVIFG